MYNIPQRNGYGFQLAPPGVNIRAYLLYCHRISHFRFREGFAGFQIPPFVCMWLPTSFFHSFWLWFFTNSLGDCTGEKVWCGHPSTPLCFPSERGLWFAAVAPVCRAWYSPDSQFSSWPKPCPFLSARSCWGSCATFENSALVSLALELKGQGGIWAPPTNSQGEINSHFMF